MSNKRKDNKVNYNLKKVEEKILYGINKIVCFACGETIEKETEVCSYCKTTIK